MIPVPSSSQKPLKPILKRSGSSGVVKSVTFSATNSQVFFADDWDRSAVEVVSKLSYSDVLELKQLSLESLPSDRHASMGLSPLLSHVPLTLCPLTSCDEPKNSQSESRAAPPSSDAKSDVSSPRVIPDLSILASPVSSANHVSSTPPRPLSPVSSDAGSSASISIGSISPRTTSESSPESSPPKISVQLTVPVPVRRPLMMNFMPLLPEPGSLPSPVLSASSSLSDSSTDTGKTLSILVAQEPITPTTPRTPNQLSPIPASPISPAFGPAPAQPSPNKNRSRTEWARYSALPGPKSGGLGPVSPTKSVAGGVSPVSPISPASDTTVSVTSGVVRPVPRRAFTPVSDVSTLTPSPELVVSRRASISSTQDLDPVVRTKASRGFDEARGAKRLAIAATAWVDGALPAHKEEPELAPTEANLRSVPLPPAPTPPRHLQRSNSLNESQPRSFKYTNPYSQIRENDEPAVDTTPRLHARRASSDRAVQRTRDLPVKESPSLSVTSHEDTLGLTMSRARPPPASMNRPVPVHRASVHGYPLGTNRPPSPTPQSFSRGYPSPLSPNVPLSYQQAQPQPRPGKPLAAKDANASRPSLEQKASYTLSDGGKGMNGPDRKPRSVNEAPILAPAITAYSNPLTRPKNSKVSR
ncbi:hypothetical protein RSOLAG22IIIB_02726 [Rhizoctonia solani]|uniref:Uncharacterized protein n=1 Tax=Rhizoctonia solani TaxID=456999 RepID=A0A0K6GIC0_9AGAM|nr:hypothetical protein RSOLAG22IIIB_02726 [Rhizoctonia solani]